MAKSCKIERKQKEFLKEMKRKLSCEEDQTGNGISYSAIKTVEIPSQKYHPTIVVGGDRK